MKNLIVTISVLCLAAGCQSQSNMSQAREDAQKRWQQARAQVLCSLATEYLKAGQLDKAAGSVQDARALDPASGPACLLGGRVAIEQGKYLLAIADLTKFCEQSPKNAEARYLLAVAQEKNGDLEQALKSYRQASDLDRGNIFPVMAAAEVLILLNRAPEAQEYFAPYVDRGGADPAVYELAGRMAMMTRGYAKAAEYFQQAHDLDFGNVRYREALAEAQYRDGRFARATETYTDLLGLQDYTPSAMTYCRLGDCYMALHDAAHAKNMYLKATELSPTSAGAWAKHAEAALALKDEARAIASAQASLDLEPDNVQAATVLGYAMVRSGKSRQALPQLRQAAAAHPQSAMLQVVMGRAYDLSGDAAKAKECYEQALKIDDQNALAQALLAGAVKNAAGQETPKSSVN